MARTGVILSKAACSLVVSAVIFSADARGDGNEPNATRHERVATQKDVVWPEKAAPQKQATGRKNSIANVPAEKNSGARRREQSNLLRYSGASWSALPYSYIVIDQELKEALAEFGRNVNVPVRLSPAIGGRRVKGPFSAGPDARAEDFLQRLCDSYGLVWYFDGTVLHISPVEEVDTELIRLDRGTSSAALRSFEDLGLSDPRFVIRVADNGGMLAVSGPPPYRSRIREAVLAVNNSGKSQAAKEAELTETLAVRVFRGGR